MQRSGGVCLFLLCFCFWLGDELFYTGIHLCPVIVRIHSNCIVYAVCSWLKFYKCAKMHFIVVVIHKLVLNRRTLHVCWSLLAMARNKKLG